MSSIFWILCYENYLPFSNLQGKAAFVNKMVMILKKKVKEQQWTDSLLKAFQQTTQKGNDKVDLPYNAVNEFNSLAATVT